MKRVGYLGPKGTFSEQAFMQYAGTQEDKIEGVPTGSIVALFNQIRNKDVDEIVVPIENSVEGSVSLSLDLLVDANDIYVKNEIILPIQHCLMVAPDNQDTITQIVSHPQALAQCQQFIREHYPDATIVESLSTAKAAAQLLDPPPIETGVIAAIGNRRLADVYGLKLIAENINDYTSNTTRFDVFSREQTQPTGNDKTAIVFSTTKDRPGGLYDILGEFASRQINLTRITSRPTKKLLGDYIFFVDCDGHQLDPPVKAALDAIASKTSFFKILGSFPAGQYKT